MPTRADDDGRAKGAFERWSIAQSVHSDRLRFTPTTATLDGLLACLEAGGPATGGTVDAAVRRVALGSFRRPTTRRLEMPTGWRHPYDSLRFGELVWRSDRMRVPALPAHVPTSRAAGDDDVPALATENAGGIVHLGATYLDPDRRAGDPRVTLCALADARRDEPAAVDAILGTLIAPRADRFVALGTAFQNCGAFVDVPAGVALDAPLQLLWLGRPGETTAVFPKTVVRIGDGASVTIVERHAGSRENVVAGTVEIVVGRGARLDYVVVQQADDGARLALRRAARVEAGGTIAWHLAELGGALSRSVAETRLVGDGARVEASAVACARGFAHLDLALASDHRANDTSANALTRLVLMERSRARVAGGPRSARGAGVRGTDAVRSDGTLMLGRTAGLLALPSLEAVSRETRYRRSATVGSLDPEALFYVAARGISAGRAVAMLALAYLEPAIARLPTEALRDEIRSVLDERLDAVPETFAS